MTAILITRPQAAAAGLAEELERQGYETLIEPLLKIAPTGAPMPAEVADAVMITSGNVLDALAVRRHEIRNLLALPCFCVGPRTAGRAEAFGFRDVKVADNDGVALAQLIARQHPSGGTILHICGQDIDGGAQEDLAKSGFHAIGWPVYAAIPATGLSGTAIQKLRQGGLDAVVVFSPRTAEVLAALLQRSALEACCGKLGAICLSAAVADRLKPLNWRFLAAASRPTEDAVIACLKQAYPASREQR